MCPRGARLAFQQAIHQDPGRHSGSRVVIVPAETQVFLNTPLLPSLHRAELLLCFDFFIHQALVLLPDQV
jgi:hypothetical protein